MTAQPSASPRPKQKLSLGCLLGIVASCILAMVVVCLATLILVGLAPDNLPTTTPNPLTPRVVATSTPQVIGSMMVSSEGGQFSKDGLRITIPRGASAQPGELKISRYNDASSQKDTQDYRSSTYQIEGDFQSIKGEIEIAIVFPPEALSPASDQSIPLIVLESAAVAPSLGKTQTRFPLASRVDAANNQIVAVLKPGAVASATKSIRGLAAPLLQRAELEKIVRVRAYKGWYAQSNAQFFVIYHRSTKVSADRADDLLKILDDQKSRLEKMGFAVGAVKYPIQVHIQVMADAGGWNCGWFSCNIMVNRDFLTSLKGSTGDEFSDQAMHVMAGHEYLHAIQHYDGMPDTAYWTWFAEATAAWYEPNTLDVPLNPAIPVKYRDFYRDSLMAAVNKSNTEAQRHGYGSSSFIRYLTNQYGDSIMLQTYAELKRRDYGSHPLGVLNNVLQVNQNTNIASEWTRFLQTWFLESSKIWSGGRVAPETSKVAFSATASGASQYKIVPTFKPIELIAREDGKKVISADVPPPAFSRLTQGIVAPKLDGTFGAIVNDSFELKFQLGDLAGDAVELLFDLRGDGGKVFAMPTDVRVEIDAPVDCGILLYATRRDGNGYGRILGADNYPAGSLPATKSSQVIKSVSHDSGTGMYKGLLIVAFNRGTSIQSTSKTIRVTVSYQLPLLPTPTPTATPSLTPRPTNTTTRTPTRTLTPTASPTPKTAPKDPNVLCGCVTKFQTTVLTKQKFDTCKEVYGSKCLSSEVRVTKPWTYNPTTKMCVGSFAYWQCRSDQDPQCHNEPFPDQEVTLDHAQKRCDEIGQK